MAYCATLNVTEARKGLRRIKGCCAIIDVTEAMGAYRYGESIEAGLLG